MVCTYLLTESCPDDGFPAVNDAGAVLLGSMCFLLMVSTVPYRVSSMWAYIKAHPFQLLVAGVLLLMWWRCAGDHALHPRHDIHRGGAVWSWIAHAGEVRRQKKDIKRRADEGITGQDHHI